MDQNNIKLTFDSSVKNEILEFIGKSVDCDGFIVEKDNPKQRVLTVDGEEITLDEFGGFQRGSEVFIKNDLVSLMRLSKEK
jgi:hypothetical protein